MKHNLLVMDVDKDYATKRIAELDDEIVALGPEFRNAFTQTSETWHDNAPFEAVRDQQTVLAAERHQLKQVLNNSLPSIPKQKKGVVGIGSIVKIRNTKTDKTTTYSIAGEWTYQAGHKTNGAIIMSCQSPLAKTIFGKKAGTQIFFNVPLVIEEIN